MGKVQLRPLGEARNIIEGMELEITHVHDDLIFIEHNAFLMRFDDECENNLFLHFNEDCEPDKIDSITAEITKRAEKEGFTIMKDQMYKMRQKEETEELEIVFY